MKLVAIRMKSFEWWLSLLNDRRMRPVHALDLNLQIPTEK